MTAQTISFLLQRANVSERSRAVLPTTAGPAST
jgi:hypothetical protein